jgi:hypothetical protein
VTAGSVIWDVQQTKVPERESPRYVFEQPLAADLGTLPVIVIDLSSKGAQIQSGEPLRANRVAQLLIGLPGASEKVPLNGRIVWTQLAKAADGGGGWIYRSGVKLDDTHENGSVVSILLKAYPARLEKGTVEQRVQTGRPTMRFVPTPTKKIDPDRVMLILQVSQRLKQTPGESKTLASRARSALSVSVHSVVHTENELAVWEYLQHVVSIDDITEVLNA